MGTEKLFDIQEELKKLPDHPGVYIMHDDRDAIIYIGKAISLRNRVRQYFQTSRNKGPKIEKMVTHIDHFEYILTDSELERMTEECLTENPYITGIENFSCVKIEEKVTVTFSLITELGDGEVSIDV